MTDTIEHHETCPYHPTCHSRYAPIFTRVKAAMSRVPSLPEVHFAPWTGENFGDKVVLGHHRILLVGESHYEWCDLCRTEGNERTADLTSFCIAERISLIDCVK